LRENLIHHGGLGAYTVDRQLGLGLS